MGSAQSGVQAHHADGDVKRTKKLPVAPPEPIPSLVLDKSKLLYQRRRDCDRLKECEERWLRFAPESQRHLQAKCPDACSFFEPYSGPRIPLDSRAAVVLAPKK